jgi:hypothetical protein
MKKKILIGIGIFILILFFGGLYLYFNLDFWLKDPLKFPKNDKYTIEAISFKNHKDKNIYGVAYIPKREKETKFPLVILSHGYSSSHLFMTGYGTRLAENGIACYNFDFSGGSNLSKSEGKTTEMSVLTEKEDLKAALSNSKSWSFVDTTNIFLCGESQGGFVTALAGVEVADRIRGMILLYPAFHMPEAMRKSYPIKDSIKDVMDFPNNMKIGRIYVEDLYDMDAYETTKNFKKEVLIIHGDKDKAVPITYAERAVKEYPSADLKVIKGAGHVFFWKRQVDEAVRDIIEFINKNSTKN